MYRAIHRGEWEKECQKCLAYDKIIDPNGDAYYQEIYDDLEADLENITNDFLHFAELRVLN
ncbi:hypothetical protein HpM004_08090 [Helicobacter pylori]